jgi:AhpD family alkylhydroperoxidase
MTSQEQHLSGEQQELVAVGASVGAGCQPCVSHHLSAGAKAGLDGEQLLAAVASAERVRAEAAVAIGDHARATLGPDLTSLALLSRLEETLASLGAALGANDATNIERQLRAATDLGATRTQLEQAIETVHNVQESAARIHLREAERLLDTLAPATTVASDAESGSGCSCGTDEKTEEVADTTEEPEPVAAASGHGCGEMAAHFGMGGTSGAMAGCREMFERFMPATAPAETNKTPAATTAAGPCKKEA